MLAPHSRTPNDDFDMLRGIHEAGHILVASRRHGILVVHATLARVETIVAPHTPDLACGCVAFGGPVAERMFYDLPPSEITRRWSSGWRYDLQNIRRLCRDNAACRRGLTSRAGEHDLHDQRLEPQPV